MTFTGNLHPTHTHYEEEPSKEELEQLEQEKAEGEFSNEELDSIMSTKAGRKHFEDSALLYCKEAAKLRITSEEEIIKLFQRYEKGDSTAKDRIIEGTLLLCVKPAGRHSKNSIEFLDLIQEGNLGLMKAVDRFDYRRGYHFSTYAYWWIRQAITRAIADKSRTIRLPVHLDEEIRKVTKVSSNFFALNGREPTIEEIVEVTDLSAATVTSILNSISTTSLNTPVNGESPDDSDELEAFIPDSYELEDEIEKKDSSRNTHKSN